MGGGSYTQPVAPGQGDIVLATEKPKKSRLWVFVAMGVVLVVGGILAAVMALGNTGGNVSDDGETDRGVLELLDESYGQIVSIQSTFVKGVQGKLQIPDFFSEENKNGLSEMVDVVVSFWEKTKRYDSALLSNDYTREEFKILKEALDNDIPRYENLFNIYTLFYNYINNGYDKAYREEIAKLGNSEATRALNNLDQIVKGSTNYSVETIIQDIFKAALGENYPEVYYYEPIGNIIGGLGYEE